MAKIHLVFLWHMHQPFYKDLVSGRYRLPWVRMHALKDYYGMVKLLDEFPDVHQTFNLVPSLLAQIQDYVSGTAHDPWLEIASKPAADLSQQERRFALDYLFQANITQMIGRYPRYRELWERFTGAGQRSDRAERFFDQQDYTDLQVLSQLAWFDEFFLQQPEVAALVRKARNYSLDDQRFVTEKQREIVSTVIPAYAAAAKRGSIEISTSPFYHPILPLLCDSDLGAVSSPGLTLPAVRFRYPGDARTQLERGLDLHQEIFGRRPQGAWPSEGSVADPVLGIGHQLGLKWMATDEGILARSLGIHLDRDGRGRLSANAAAMLYSPYLWQQDGAEMRLLFRDRSLSDLIGFVYSGMNAADAAAHFVHNLKESAQPVLKSGKDALVPVILDGENAWEFYPHSGREFLRRLYDALQRDPVIDALTVSEALDRHPQPARLPRLAPGSWINSNFNVWIGAPEDNRSWEALAAARDFYDRAAPAATEERRALAFEELLIAEGSDWNWWYGPEHHTANDRDFDELYRTHLSNVYQTLGAAPPISLAQPIAASQARPTFTQQTAFIHPHVGTSFVRYFDWMGAATYTADRHAGAMHGKVFLLDAFYAGINETHLFARVDFIGAIPEEPFDAVLSCDVMAGTHGEARVTGPAPPLRTFALHARIEAGKLATWRLVEGERVLASQEVGPDGKGEFDQGDLKLSAFRNFETKLPLRLLQAGLGSTLRLRFSLWREQLPLDALPLEGAIELPVVTETELESSVYNYSPYS
ncbi:MAG TPA: glycoside hydrolase family 57 protein [Terriglobales bacterium]|nr:glycoside hydrolase family 57 protein [Terriglobales bacterium]